jgi:uncharacterized OB-fold protein
MPRLFLPTPTKISQPFWDSCKARAMKIQRCEACGTFAFYPVYMCPECASRRLEWTPVSGKGTVYTFTVSPKSSFDEERVVALIELAEGAMMTSNIVNVDPSAVRIGMRVRLCYEPVNDDITLPVFEPDE